MKKIFFLLIVCALAFIHPALFAQRKMEKLDRGVVGVWKADQQLYVSWRYFATDPEDIAFNVYRQTGANEPVKLNATPIDKTTNLTVNAGSRTTPSRITVRPIINGVEGEADGYWDLTNTATTRIVRDFNFEPVPGVTENLLMTYCWVADLDGDGKYDFVLERQGSSTTPRVEAYSSEGEFKWRINVGVNVVIAEGHNDMVTAYDMDGDNKAEVLLITGEGTTFADGMQITGSNGLVTDYRNRAGSAPQWLSIIDGQTGVEIDRAEIPFFNELTTTRTDSWKHMQGHFIIAYLDGINPYLIYQYKNRLSNGNFQGAHAAWRFVNKKLVLHWAHKFDSRQEQFHQVRVADVDGDGIDEFIEGGYILNGKDGMVMHYNTGAVHGDRHAITDIDPDRPGLEHFVIQQDNPSRLGMAIYDATTGDMIKGIYMSAVADVARGVVAALDPNIRGLQIATTQSNRAVYDCMGNPTGFSYNRNPSNPLWWDGDLSREHSASSDGAGENLIIEKVNSTNNGTRLFNLGYEPEQSSWYLRSTSTRAHPAFWGDILGDWREELIVRRNDNTGFAIITTTDETPHRIYNLMQNPAYRCQSTAKGYYQTSDVDYYFAEDMPDPPLSPVQKADLYYTEAGWIDDNNDDATYDDGKTVMFDIRGGNSTFSLNGDMAPRRVFVINPKGKDYIFSGGKFTGAMDFIKALQGTATLNGDHDYTGVTRISEGKLIVNGALASKMRIDARGILAGNAELNGGIVLETGLNKEGGRIEPGDNYKPGTITIEGDLVLPGRNNLVFNIDQSNPVNNSKLIINGNFHATGTNHSLIFRSSAKILGGDMTLIEYTGSSNVTADNFNIEGLDDLNYKLLFEQGRIRLVIEGSNVIITDNLPNGTVAVQYSTSLEVTGEQPIICELEDGNLPDGLILAYDGTVSGIATEAGTFVFTVKVSNYTGSNKKELTILINKGAGATVAQPTLDIATNNSITVNELILSNGQLVEYAINSAEYPPANAEAWHTERSFNNLSENWTYYIYARSAANDNYNTGEPSEPLVAVAKTQTTTGIDNPLQSNSLKTWTNNGILYISGLTEGKLWQLLSVSGALIYQGIATAETEEIPLNVSGAYFIIQGDKNVRVVY